MAEGSIEKRAKDALAFLVAMRDAGASCIQAQNALHNQGTGKIAELFPTDSDQRAWQDTPEYAELWRILEEMPLPMGKAAKE
ncbi:hypothetical protein [Lignipirellula cremea]|uniref:Uncharacterized protein n=1 Tax=Lignipirellula cremea TaxID=2528010 RepID=A0A518DZS1_9BACT|nr:hypothetical protein [Lignipirellula cremea]QDU97334.1 hypothetical protein Pla8534_51800 [Lignipirellula cremea]